MLSAVRVFADARLTDVYNNISAAVKNSPNSKTVKEIKKSYKPKIPWYIMDEEYLMDYVKKHATVYGAESLPFDFYFNLFDSNDLVLFGEIHDYKIPRKMSLRMVWEYNKKFPSKAVKNVFFEEDESFQHKVTQIEEAFKDADEKEIEKRCDSFYSSYCIPDEAACRLIAQGVKFTFIDLDHDPSMRYIKGTSISLLSDEGLTKRNEAMFKKIKEAVEKDEKSVFLGGQAHIYNYGFNGNSQTLTMLAKNNFNKNIKFTSVIHAGGAWEDDGLLPRHIIEETKDYKSFKGKGSPDKFEKWQATYAFEENAVIKMVPKGMEKHSAYKAPPADYMVIFHNKLYSKNIFK